MREEYGLRHGQRFEVQVLCGRERPAPPKAKQSVSGMGARVDGRIAAIRAERSGEGVALTGVNKPARSLASGTRGSSLGIPPGRRKPGWEDLRERVHEALREAAGEGSMGTPATLTSSGAKTLNSGKPYSPVLADVGETGAVAWP